MDKQTGTTAGTAGAAAQAAGQSTAHTAADDTTVAASAAPASAQADNGGGSGLASVAQIVELADQLSACADQLHERIMRDIRAYEGRTVPDAVQAAARALLDDEVVLRQRANGLYADAATYIVKSLGKSQRSVIALTTEAAEKIRKITLIGDVTGLVGGLLQLAGAAATGQAASVVGALDRIRAHMAAIQANQPPPPASKSA
ncbi:hypothetical protein QPK31_20035 [Massilia sp. YIM B02769]|uniref:hypothetical protein n=1 Tax=Massilia sp. YIM B02769 TaxID=3050129 RepID=UPI0025B728B8|nr:hypothetical protein [Massilia sp. YIM B02769]MDN4060503.1 hypothetical protein [Massilia sp. YIM B02769]